MGNEVREKLKQRNRVDEMRQKTWHVKEVTGNEWIIRYEKEDNEGGREE